MARTDFWELKDNQKVGQIDILNVYHCKKILAGATAVDIANAYINSVLTVGTLNMQDDLLTRSNIVVQNLGDPTDFAIVDSSGFPGLDVNDHVPLFVAVAIQFNRTRTDMRHGQKRWVMGNETDMLQGIWDATMQAEISTLGTAVITPWRTAAAPGVDVCAFAILKRFCVVEGQTPCLKYRLAKDDPEIDGFHYIPTTFTIRNNARSQVSRKAL